MSHVLDRMRKRVAEAERRARENLHWEQLRASLIEMGCEEEERIPTIRDAPTTEGLWERWVRIINGRKTDGQA